MKFLLIEDDQHKSKQIAEYLNNILPDCKVEIKKSYQSGLKEILTNIYDLILLDMQLPNFDIKFGEDGYKFRQMAGIDILKELKRKKKQCKVIVVTQFETFGEGESYIDLIDLKQTLKTNFLDIYLDTVFYSPDKSIWQKELNNLIISHFESLS
jgi:CheY-like chemotaxis protein